MLPSKKNTCTRPTLVIIYLEQKIFYTENEIHAYTPTHIAQYVKNMCDLEQVNFSESVLSLTKWG